LNADLNLSPVDFCPRGLCVPFVHASSFGGIWFILATANRNCYLQKWAKS